MCTLVYSQLNITFFYTRVYGKKTCTLIPYLKKNEHNAKHVNSNITNNYCTHPGLWYTNRN